MLVPNLPEDKAGLYSRVFFHVSPILQKGKALKKSNRPLYLLIKWTLNLIILALLVAVLSVISTLAFGFFKALM